MIFVFLALRPSSPRFRPFFSWVFHSCCRFQEVHPMVQPFPSPQFDPRGQHCIDIFGHVQGPHEGDHELHILQAHLTTDHLHGLETAALLGEPLRSLTPPQAATISTFTPRFCIWVGIQCLPLRFPPPIPWQSTPRRRGPCSVRSRGNRSWDSPHRARTARRRSSSCT